MSTVSRVSYAGGIIAATVICSAVSILVIRKKIDRAFAELMETNAAGAEEGATL